MAGIQWDVNGAHVTFFAFETWVGYPSFQFSDGRRGPSGVHLDELDAGHIRLDYGDGCEIDIRRNGSRMVFSQNETMASRASEPVMRIDLTMLLSEIGGRWDMDGVAPGSFGPAHSEFPRDYIDTYCAFEGNVSGVRLSTGDGNGEELSISCRSFMRIQDFRQSHNCSFCLTICPEMQENSFKMALGFEDGPATPAIDRYGQFIQGNWPQKVRSDDDLKADIASDKEFYDSLPEIPQRTFWGGLPGSREKYNLTATGFFHLENVNGHEMLVEPEGNLYFHIGMCGMVLGNEVTCIEGREGVFEELPPHDDYHANAWFRPISLSFYALNFIRKFGWVHYRRWQTAVVPRIRRWGFNSFGEFNFIYDDNDKVGFGVTFCLEHYAWRKDFHKINADFIDPYDEYNFPLLEEDFKERTAEYLGNPIVIGYYTENERVYTEVVPTLLAKTENSASKIRFAQLMKERHGNDIASFNAAWRMNLDSFDAIGAASLSAGTDIAKEDLFAFEMIFFDDYFRLLSETLKKVDPQHLYLGERLLPWQTHHIPSMKGMGKHCDVFSVNYYTNEYNPDDINRWAEITGRPIMLSEWSFGCHDQGLYGCREKATEEERGAAYSRYVENAAASGKIVGIQWFVLVDEANTGRGWTSNFGERFNMGFVNVCDRPYRRLVEHATVSNGRVYDLIEGKIAPVAPRSSLVFNSDNRSVKLPRLPDDFIPLSSRPGELTDNLVVNRLTACNSLQADRGATALIAWNSEYLMAWLTVPEDTTRVDFFLGGKTKLFGKMRRDDRQISIDMNSLNASWLRNMKPVPAETKLYIALSDPVDGKRTLTAAIPWRETAVSPRDNLEFGFDLSVTTESEASDEPVAQLFWNGLPEDDFRRELWGTAVLNGGCAIP